MKTATVSAPEKQKRKLQMPDAYVLLFMIALICTIATYFVPAGEFDRKTSGEITTAVMAVITVLINHQLVRLVFLQRFKKGWLVHPLLFF